MGRSASKALKTPRQNTDAVSYDLRPLAPHQHLARHRENSGASEHCDLHTTTSQVSIKTNVNG